MATARRKEHAALLSQQSYDVVVVDEAHPRCSIATDISALVAQKAFGALRAPIEMVTAPHTPVPFSNALEDIYIPDAQRVVSAVKTVTGWTP